jgi:hypothetical protein
MKPQKELKQSNILYHDITIQFKQKNSINVKAKLLLQSNRYLDNELYRFGGLTALGLYRK